MTRLRVLHVITGLGLGGTETWLLRLLSRLPAERFDCRVVSLLDPVGESGALAGPIHALGVPVDGLGLRRDRTFGGFDAAGALWRLMKIMRSFRPQVVQTWLYHADLLGLLAARLSGCGTAVSWGLRCAFMDFAAYGADTRLVVRACASLSRWPEAVTANSHAGAAHHLALGYRPRRLVVLTNGVDTLRFHPDATARTRLRAEWGVDDETPVLGLLARMDHMKGQDTFCRAGKLALRRHPGARLLFCGADTRPGAAGLDGLVAENGLENAVIRLGRRDDPWAVLAALDGLALASRGEGFPNVVAEALACGVPVTGLEAGDARLVAGPGGMLATAPAADDETARVATLEERIAALLDMPHAQREEMGRMGREHVAAHYGLDAAAARWAAHFEALATQRR